jgi:hypothetical protein
MLKAFSMRAELTNDHAPSISSVGPVARPSKAKPPGARGLDKLRSAGPDPRNEARQDRDGQPPFSPEAHYTRQSETDKRMTGVPQPRGITRQ